MGGDNYKHHCISCKCIYDECSSVYEDPVG